MVMIRAFRRCAPGRDFSVAALSSSLARAEEERIRAESLYNEVVRNPESAPQVLDNKAVQALKDGKAPEVSNTDPYGCSVKYAG